MFNRMQQILCLIFCAMLMPMYTYANDVSQLLHQTNDPIGGNPQGKISVVEFFDYQCSHCVNMAPVMTDIIKANPDLRVIYKDFPIRGPASVYAARAALAANRQGKYLAFSHLLLNVDSPLSEEIILKKAHEAGLNTNQLAKDIESKKIDNQIQATYALAQSLHVTGTPAFFIAKSDATSMQDIKFILGEMNQNQLQAQINNLKKS